MSKVESEGTSLVGVAVSIPVPGITDDGVPIIKRRVIASDFDTAAITISHIEEIEREIVDDKVGILSTNSFGDLGGPIRKGTSFTGAFDGNDSNVSRWQPIGPKPPGKPRLN